MYNLNVKVQKITPKVSNLDLAPSSVFNYNVNTIKICKEELYIIFDKIIDIFACVGKFHIDKIDTYPIVKDICKLSVDVVAYFLKKFLNTDIVSVRNIASRCDIEKVVALPYYLPNGEKIILLRVYGNNPELFFSQIGIYSTLIENNENINKIIDMIEYKYGLVIYQKS